MDLDDDSKAYMLDLKMYMTGMVALPWFGGVPVITDQCLVLMFISKVGVGLSWV